MTRPIRSRGLLKTARRLADQDGPGRPPLSDLRRATSTAYYALFHAISQDGARDFFLQSNPDGSVIYPRDKEVAEVARWYSHTGILKASRAVTTAASSKKLDQIGKQDQPSVNVLRRSGGRGVPPQLLLVADAFQSLQDARHSADYDGNYDPVRWVTISFIDDAEEAVKATESLWRARSSPKSHARERHNSYLLFLRLALLFSGPPKTR